MSRVSDDDKLVHEAAQNSLGLSLGSPPAYAVATDDFSSSPHKFPSLVCQSRSQSPAGTTSAGTLLWTDGGWNAGHFAFAFGDDDDEEGELEQGHGRHRLQDGDDGKEDVVQQRESMGRTLRRVKKGLNDLPGALGLGLGDDDDDKLNGLHKHSDLGSDHRSRLHIETDLPAHNSSSTFSATSQPLTANADSFEPSSFQYSPVVSEPHGAPTDWAFDQHGNLVNAGARYEVADEILDMQGYDVPTSTRPLEFSDPYSVSSQSSRLSAFDRELLRRRSEPAALRQPVPARSPAQVVAAFDNTNNGDVYSSRWYQPRQRASESNLTPLQNYFSAPIGQQQRVHAPPPPPTPPLTPGTLSEIATLPLQTDPEDILYTTARETFVDQSLAGVSIPQSVASRQTMMSHFDKAMHAAHPLATLYGLTPEAADALAANPGTSGVSEDVLRLALIREKQQKAAGAPGLPGPSPNNRKLALYKTELCRSWEERGVCRYGVKCQFAHGPHELRAVERHPKFKSEICRTFWLHGSCQYGARCCFIHTTVPGGAAATVPGLPTPKTLDVELLKKSSSISSDPMTSLHKSLSSLSMASTNLPSGFGPHLAEFLQPSTPQTDPFSRSSSSSGASSPTEVNRSGSSGSRRSGSGSGSSNMSGSVLSTSNFVSPLSSIGVKPPGKFTNNPFEVPPTYQDQPQSRLKRLASLPSSSSSSTLLTQRTVTPMPSAPSMSRSPAGGSGSGASTPASAPHTRHSSISSLMSASSAATSSFMNRTASTSSLSSFAGSTSYVSNNNGLVPLTPVTPEWLPSSSSSPTSLMKKALDWDSPPSTTQGDCMSTSVMFEHGGDIGESNQPSSDEPRYYSSSLGASLSSSRQARTLRPSPIFKPLSSSFAIHDDDVAIDDH
ncbi:hypothetical protein ACM66B_002527 [Microbotryomycetes sp. NB124-2]